MLVSKDMTSGRNSEPQSQVNVNGLCAWRTTGLGRAGKSGVVIRQARNEMLAKRSVYNGLGWR